MQTANRRAKHLDDILKLLTAFSLPSGIASSQQIG
jgi:hypothetical protein